MFGRLYRCNKPGKRKMALTPLLLVLSASIFSLTGSFLTAQNAFAKLGQKEWILQQQSDMGGSTTVYCTDDAVKIKTTKLGCHLICRAPDWKVHCYQPNDSLEWVGDLKLFSGIVMGNPYALPKAPRPLAWKNVGQGDFRGLKYSNYKTAAYGNRVICLADDIPLAPKAAEFLSRLYTMPVLTKVPVFCTGRKLSAPLKVEPTTIRKNDYNCAVDLRNGDVEYLTTTSWKSMPYREADFALPKNFKRVSDIIQVTFSADKRDQFGDMLDNVGFTTKFDKNSGKRK